MPKIMRYDGKSMQYLGRTGKTINKTPPNLMQVAL
jgi:hypothetical protein